jgi:uncharacterized protein (DUF488 family)
VSDAREIWTIGHWTCPVPDFLTPLDDAGIELLADVRAHPGSRRNPQFGSEAMARWLPEDGIDYRHLAALGGRRRKQAAVDPDLNAAWQNASFKNYADYTLTAEYRDGIDELAKLASSRRVTIMCGEPMPWRCHRLLISNTLTAQGWTVRHLMTGGKTREHVLGQWGAMPVVDDSGRLTYPPHD